MLEKLEHPPHRIFMENVKTFEGSDTLEQFQNVLQQRGYSWQCYLLSPRDFGIPNHRTRFYILAERNSERYQTIPHQPQTRLDQGENDPPAIRPLSEFLLEETLPEEIKEELRVSDKVLAKTWAKALSVVGRLDHTTFCFTKAYGKVIHKASGSFLFENATVPFEEQKLDRTDMLAYSGCIRAFHPRELLNLFGFPQWFTFPPQMTTRYQYQLIGNSVNVTVVAALLNDLLRPEWEGNDKDT